MRDCFRAQRRLAAVGFAAAVLTALAWLTDVAELPAADRAEGPLPIGATSPAELPGLHNVFRLSEKLYSGAQPEGEAGFRSLQRLGIRTVLSVDGARPDVEAARRHGMRTVHLPFGYDGCPLPTANRIVRAVRDLPGPIYVHCHHGKHRGPTAAAFPRIALDGLSPEAAVREMERAGTGKEYLGLYNDVRAYRPPTPAELDRLPADFPEVAPTPPLTEAMVQIEHRFDGLTQCRKAGWQSPPNHPDLTPAHEALQLRELFAEMRRTPAVQQRPEPFGLWAREAEEHVAALEAALRAGQSARADEWLARVAAGCATCHARYRNVPQGQS